MPDDDIDTSSYRLSVRGFELFRWEVHHTARITIEDEDGKAIFRSEPED